jgi:hypothetical protein
MQKTIWQMQKKLQKTTGTKILSANIQEQV